MTTSQVSPVEAPRSRLGEGAGIRAAVLMVAFVGANANLNLKPILISSYIGFLKLSSPQAGYVVGLEAGAGALVTALAASLLGRIDGRRLFAAAAALIILGNLLSVLAHAFVPLAAARFVAGVGHGAAMAVCAAGVASFPRPARVSAAVAILVSISAMGLTLVIPWLQAAVGVSSLFLTMAVLLAPSLLMLRWLPQPRAALPQAPRPEAALPPMRAVIAITVITIGCFYVSVGSFWPYVAEVGKLAGLDYRAATSVAAAAYAAAMAGALAAAYLSERLNRACLTAAAILVAIASQAALALVSPTPATYAVCTVSFMFCWGMIYPLFMGFSSSLDPSGKLNGYVGMLAAVGIAIGPTLGGYVTGLADGPAAGLRNLLWMSVAFLVAALGLVPAMQRFGVTAPGALRSTDEPRSHAT